MSDVRLTDFGAVPDVDSASAGLANKTAFLNAFDALKTANKSRLGIPRARFFLKDDFSIDVPAGIKLCGEDIGPVDLYGRFGPGETPATKTVAPTLLFRDQVGLPLAPGGSCSVRLAGDNAIQDLLFWHPDQHSPGWGSGFIDYPWVIGMGNDAFRPGALISRVAIPFVTRGIQCWGGRYIVEDTNIGALYNGVRIDGCADSGSLRGVSVGPRWGDVYGGPGYNSSNADAVAQANLFAFQMRRSDAFDMSECSVFQAYCSFDFGVAGQDIGPFGFARGLRSEFCTYGIILESHTSPNGVQIESVYFANATPGGSYFRAQPGSGANSVVTIKAGWVGGYTNDKSAQLAGGGGYYDFKGLIGRIPVVGEQ